MIETSKSMYIRFLKRPIAAFMFFLGILFLGIIALTRLSVDLLPDLAYPRIVIYTASKGMSAEEVEREVLLSQQSLLSSLPQVRSMQGISEEGFAILVLTFTRIKSIETTIILIKEKLSSFIGGKKGALIEEPVIMHHDPNSRPVAVLSLTSDEVDIAELTDLAENVLVRRFSQLDGVGRVSVEGGAHVHTLFLIDRGAIEEYGILPSHVARVLETSVKRLGTIMEGRNSYSVRLVKGNSEDLGALFIPYTGLRLNDIGSFGFQTERDGYVAFNGKRGVALVVEKRYGANTLGVIDELKESLPSIASYISSEQGKEINLDIAFHEAGFIEDAMKSVLSALTLGALLTLITLLVSLGSFRHTIAVGVSIPLSVIASFLLFYLKGITLNIMSLGGIALGIGMMVDNSVVVSEAIHRQLKISNDKLRASYEGIKEVAAPVTASTLTTIAVFLPIVFIEGPAARLFADLAYAVSFSLLISLFISLTLLPVVIARVGSYGAWGERINHFWVKLEKLYEELLHRLNKKGFLVIACFVLVFILSVIIGLRLPKELLPDSGKENVRIFVTAPPGASFETMVNGMNLLAQKIAGDKVLRIWTNAGRSTDPRFAFSFPSKNKGYIRIIMKDDTDTAEFLEEVEITIKAIPSLQEYKIYAEPEVNPLEEVLRYSLRPITVRITGTDRAVFPMVAYSIIQEINRKAGLLPDRIDGLGSREVYNVSLDTNLLTVNNINPAEVIEALEQVLQGVLVNRNTESIVVAVHPENSLDAVMNTSVRIGGSAYRLNNLLRIDAGSGFSRIYSYNQQRLVELIFSDTGENRNIITAGIEKAIQEMQPTLTRGFRVEIGGETEEMRSSFKHLYFAFTLALVLVYMIMAAQFESLKYPLIIIITIPMASIGVIVIFLIFHISINIMSIIGFTVALGIVINDSIILTSAVITIKKEQPNNPNAPIMAAGRRFRPIIITTVTTISGMLPMALGTEAAARLRTPLAAAVIGGLITATILTLIIHPLIYMRMKD